MYNLKINTYLKIILVISFISLISVIYIEFILGHQPCNLCLIERIPYILSIILIILNYILKNNQKFIILLLIFVFSFSFILSFYHFGIEQDYFKESAACGLKNASDIISREEILKQLQVKTVSCKDVTFRILGFSLTTLNMTLSLILAFLLIKIFRDYEKYK